MQSRKTPTAQAIHRTGVVGLMAATGPAVWLVGGAILFTAGCDGMADGPATQKAPAVETRKTLGKTTQNVLQLSEARKAGGEVAEMTITGEGIDVYADAYRTSVGKLAMIAVTQKMQLHNAEHGADPATYEEFMSQIIGPGKPDGLQLPMLPYYQEYAYDPAAKMIVVVEFPAKKEQRKKETTGASGL